MRRGRNFRMDKSSLRKMLLARRAALPPEEAARLSRLIQEHILASQIWQKARQVVLYSAIRNEVDLGLLFADALAGGKQALFPRCLPGKTGIMELAACPGPEAMRPGVFGILEPDPAICPAIFGADLHPDIVVTPGVGFDRRGGRLGYGAGYYDRILTGPEFKAAYLVGAAYTLQLVDNVSADPWDQRLDAVAVEDGIIICAG